MPNLEIVLANLEIALEMSRNSSANFRNGSENLTETLNKQAGSASIYVLTENLKDL